MWHDKQDGPTHRQTRHILNLTWTQQENASLTLSENNRAQRACIAPRASAAPHHFEPTLPAPQPPSIFLGDTPNLATEMSGGTGMGGCLEEHCSYADYVYATLLHKTKRDAATTASHKDFHGRTNGQAVSIIAII